MPGADSYPEGTTPYVTDPEQRLLVKICHVLNNGGGGGGPASQTPWAQNINGGGFNLTNVGDLATVNLTVAAFLGGYAVYSDVSGQLRESTATEAELSYLQGVTSAIQTQLDAKAGVSFGAFADPNGNVIGSVKDIYKSVESLGGDGSLWVKHTGTATNTGWI